MHDPMVVLFEIRRPWPEFKIMKARRQHTGTCYLSLNRLQRAWFLTKSPFWQFGRLRLYWPGLVTIWHIEPGGHDFGEVCGRNLGKGWKRIRWGWCHRHHLKVRVHAVQQLNRWLFERCAHCGGKSRKGHSVNVSHQWDGEGQKWGKPSKGLYHSQCSAVVSLTRSLAEARNAIHRSGLDALTLELAGINSTEAWRVIHYAKPLATGTEP